MSYVLVTTGQDDVTGFAPGLHLPVSELKRMRRALVGALVADVERTIEPAPQVPRLRALACALRRHAGRRGRRPSSLRSAGPTRGSKP
ncbi:MAG: hypothetical protein ABIR79_23320 [Candidatus Binatia bacterium]